ncbi:MAG: glycosyltransferase family 4 protein [Acidobacteria bacterium]|nr:glycosyltransferase family 4 protein [Acidobacteriota bacterium]
MRIGVDATSAANSRGYGRHARALLSAMLMEDQDNSYTFITDAPESIRFLPANADVRIVSAGAPTTLAAAAGGRRSAGDMMRMSRALSDKSFDLLLFPTVYSFVPVFTRARKIVMIHDVIAETFPQMTVPGVAARLFWKSKVALGRFQADAIVTVSEYSRRGILAHFRISPERIFVVGEAGDPIFRPIAQPQPTTRLQELGIKPDQRLIIYVGGFNPHKNLEALVSAFRALTSEQAFADLKLIMVGEYQREVFHSYFGIIKRQVEEMGLSDRVIFTGYLPDEDLVVLLNLGTVLVLPSLMEGFGLPAVEAAASGCPVIATTESPLPELLGNGSVFINPTNPSELVSALRRVTGSTELRAEMRSAGIAAAAALTWKAAARQMIDVIRKVGAK